MASQTATSSSEILDEALIPDLEDLLEGEVNNTEVTGPHTHALHVSGHMIHKASILRLYSHPLTMPGPTSLDRLKRVRGFKRFDNSVASELPGHSLTPNPTLFINDPAMTLVKVQQNIFLAVIQINGIQDGLTQCQSILVSNLHSGCKAKIFFQILKLTACTNDNAQPLEGVNTSEWTADGSTVKYSTDFKILEARAEMIQAFNPKTSCRADGIPIFNFTSKELTAVTCLLHERLRKSPDCHIPTVLNNDFFPYKYNGKSFPSHLHLKLHRYGFLGRVCFICQEENETTLGLDKTRCPYCGPKVFLKNGQAAITHNSCHILFDSNFQVDTPCGFCLHSNSSCTFFLRKSKNVQLDYSKCVCPRLSTFSYKSASQFTETSPCTNVPIHCPICPAHLPVVWKYNLKKHIQITHPEVSLQHYEDM